MFCVGDVVGWDSGAIVAFALVRLAISACVGSNYFSAFKQDTEIYWDVDALYSAIFFSINGCTGVYLVKYKLVLFCPWVAAGIWIYSISAGIFTFNSLCMAF